MKKVLYSVALVAALGLASCGSKEAKATEEAPATETTDVVKDACDKAEDCLKDACDKADEACCKEGEECTNEECNKDGQCNTECCQKEDAKAE